MNEDKLRQMSNFIHDYIAASNGVSPSFSEILSHMGMSNSVGYRYLTTLRDRGMIEYSGRDTLRIKGQDGMRSEALRLPIYGSIPCGTPEEHEQQALGHLAIPGEWAGKDCYLLRASGDSMVDIGIDDGDLVLIKEAREAFDGQVAAVLTENGTTLKRFRTDPEGRPFLQAENASYPVHRRRLYPARIEIQGIACKIIKNVH